jgi:hypothetical protein
MSQPVQVTFPQLAQLGLELIARATVSADDNSLALAQGTRNMLKAIVSGELVVSQPQSSAAPPPPWNPED